MTTAKGKDDWRWMGTTLASPFNTGTSVLPVGSILRSSLPVDAFGRSVRLPIPNVSATFLHLAFEQTSLASELRVEIETKADALHTCPSTCIDLFQAVMSSAILAFACLESLINMLIPPDAKFEIEHKKIGTRELKTKEQLEREPTESKLATILPQLLEYETPKGKKVWQDFKMLKKHRDRIVHFKYGDQVAGVNDDHLWGIWVDEKCPDYAEIAYSMVNYIASHIEKPPLWTKQLKQSREQSPPADLEA
ncbi:hypothetical protein P4C99_01150 [Pontiellaceae bacterium B1224]|nr:hypothetical protein [Pontiellaceae bacterium B1224]